MNFLGRYDISAGETTDVSGERFLHNYGKSIHEERVVIFSGVASRHGLLDCDRRLIICRNVGNYQLTWCHIPENLRLEHGWGSCLAASEFNV